MQWHSDIWKTALNGFHSPSIELLTSWMNSCSFMTRVEAWASVLPGTSFWATLKAPFTQSFTSKSSARNLEKSIFTPLVSLQSQIHHLKESNPSAENTNDMLKVFSGAYFALFTQTKSLQHTFTSLFHNSCPHQP